MTCETCETTRENSAHALHCPKCIYCGARLIQRLGKLKRPAAEITERRRKVLADWLAFGHDEQQLRALAKGPMPLAPIGEPEPRTPTRRR